MNKYTDEEYFEKYTPDQLEFCDSQVCEDLRRAVCDFNERGTK